MKSENSKLLLGLGIGALVGAAVGYLMTGEHRRKLEEVSIGVVFRRCNVDKHR